MRPPFKVEFWKPVDDIRTCRCYREFRGCRKSLLEAVANLRVGEVVRVRDALGTLLLSTDTDEDYGW